MPCYLNIYIEMNGHLSIDGSQLAPLEVAMVKEWRWQCKLCNSILSSVLLADVLLRSHCPLWRNAERKRSRPRNSFQFAVSLRTVIIASLGAGRCALLPDSSTELLGKAFALTSD